MLALYHMQAVSVKGLSFPLKSHYLYNAALERGNILLPSYSPSSAIPRMAVEKCDHFLALTVCAASREKYTTPLTT